jgi:hypothetical protein
MLLPTFLLSPTKNILSYDTYETVEIWIKVHLNQKWRTLFIIESTTVPKGCMRRTLEK